MNANLLVDILVAVVVVGVLVDMMKKKIPIFPKKPSKKPRNLKLWKFWPFPDYSAYPVPSVIGFMLKGVIVAFALLILWLLFISPPTY